LGLDSIPTESLDLDVGTGRLTVNLPENVGYLITYSVGVGQINLGDREIGGIGQDGDEIKSDNYDEAERVVTINADVGVGQLDINFNN
jgi:predicted membrane protein